MDGFSQTTKRQLLIHKISEWADPIAIENAWPDLNEMYATWASLLSPLRFRRRYKEHFSDQEWAEVEKFDVSLQHALKRHKNWPSNGLLLKYQSGRDAVENARLLLELLTE